MFYIPISIAMTAINEINYDCLIILHKPVKCLTSYVMPTMLIECMTYLQ